jgi:hypothetical protein
MEEQNAPNASLGMANVRISTTFDVLLDQSQWKVSSLRFQDVTLRMKQDLSMHSFISLFHRLALVFNYCTVL